MANKWTKDEEVLALALYCKVPFGKIHAHNPSIKALASMLGRTPASVSMKMCNFARFDPLLQSRGVTGLKNGSRLDAEVWFEFSANLELLEMRSKEVFQKFGIQENHIDEALLLPSGEEVEQVVHS